MFSSFVLSLVTFIAVSGGGCTTNSVNSANSANSANSVNSANLINAANSAKISVIEIKPGSPADTVRAFYAKLREKKYREAIYMTNLRPAVEGLTDKELSEFQVDFENIATQIPAEVQINGEIVSGDSATVTANLPNADTDKNEIQKIDLRREGDVWIILTVDAAAEARIKKEGKNYFYVLRVETHEDEARTMLDRIVKAQIAFAAQHGGSFTDIDPLVAGGLLPDDVKSAESTGYTYAVQLSKDSQQYTATATPAEYGKSGKLSFLVIADGKSMARITSKDIGGKQLKP